MLIKLEVENFRGIAKKLSFDLSKTCNYSFNENCVKDNVVSKGLIYGKNGTGKSSLGMALFDIVLHLCDDKNIADCFLKDNYINLCEPSKPAIFTYVFSFDKTEVTYEYGKTGPKDLVYEKLFIKKKNVIDIDYRNLSKIYVKLDGVKNLDFSKIKDNHISIIKYIYSNSLTGSNVFITKLVDFVSHMLWFRSLYGGNNYTGLTLGHQSLESMIIQKHKVSDFQAFLAKNSINYKLVEKTVMGKPTLFAEFGNKMAELNLIASSGTISLWLLYCWMLSFENVSLLFIDEFDAFYHYESAQLVLEEIKKYPDMQAFVTTHNTSLMNNSITRPDCCFIMSDGQVKSLPDCTDKEIREGHNLEKMYRNGAFND